MRVTLKTKCRPPWCCLLLRRSGVTVAVTQSPHLLLLFSFEQLKLVLLYVCIPPMYIESKVQEFQGKTETETWAFPLDTRSGQIEDKHKYLYQNRQFLSFVFCLRQQTSLKCMECFCVMPCMSVI